ncbi:ABC transporter ATP-binding protein [Castellaniella daejeonensis]|uniref:ABC transporter ATP-binding protein n=1 Tax=Castellaniella daejeonensis TaxID=659013 RepID=A0ABP3DBF3_9BURK
MKIEIQQLKLQYGKFTALHEFNLQIQDGESIVLLGQSGCGKTSAMRCVAGLERPTSGRIIIGENTVFDGAAGINTPPNKRNVGMVFQSYAIWPHMTVFENVAYSLVTRKISKADIRKQVMAALTTVGLQAFAERGASLLSGGQMQRVALARSLVMQPGALLLDEPLSNLDARLRDRLRVELRELQLRLGLTCIYVTHDQNEAFALADRIAIMQGGRIVQIDTPQNIYANPITSQIADFLGVSNVFPCEVKKINADHHVAELSDHALTVHSSLIPPSTTGATSLCVRPESFRIQAADPRAPAPGETANRWPGKIVVASFQGGYVQYAIQLDQGPEISAAQLTAEGPVLNSGDRVHVSLDPCAAQILPSELPA